MVVSTEGIQDIAALTKCEITDLQKIVCGRRGRDVAGRRKGRPAHCPPSYFV